MSGGGRPGINAVKAKVVTKTETEVVFAMEKEDVAYFEVGRDYVFPIVNAVGGGASSDNENEPNAT